jgi:hypothetical protein
MTAGPSESYSSVINSKCYEVLKIRDVNIVNFHSRTVHLDIIEVLLPTDAQENCFKSSVTIYIKTAVTCFGVITIVRERTM